MSRTDKFEAAYFRDPLSHVDDVFLFAAGLEHENAALREKLVQALAIARKYEPDEKTRYIKYASDEIAELLKEEGK